MLSLGLGIPLAIVSLIGFLINGYVLVIVILTKQVSANNILLLHLGIVDSILCMLFLIFSLPSIAKSDGAVVFEAICSVHGFLLTLMHPIALWTICCLNCDRYYAIAAPLHYSAIVNTKKVLTGLICGWLVAFLLCIPPLFHIAPYRYNTDLGICAPHFEMSGTLVYALVFTLVTLIIPSILIIGCNIRVLMIARYHRHRIAAAIFEVTLSAQVTVTHQRNPFFVPLSGQKLRSRSPVSTVLQLIGSFLVIYCPYYITILWNSSIAALHNGNVPKSLEINRYILMAVSTLLTCSSTINGIVYGLKSKVMRKTFQNYWRKKKTKNEINHEIQARTPSTCGSRRPSITTLGVLNRPIPQRRLSETLFHSDKNNGNQEKPSMKRIASELSWRPTSLTFADLKEIEGSIPHTASCNTLQIPRVDSELSSEADLEMYDNLKNSFRPALKNCNPRQAVKPTPNNNTNNYRNSLSTATALLHKVLKIEINDHSMHLDSDDQLNDDNNAIKSPRILITRAYSEDSVKSPTMPHITFKKTANVVVEYQWLNGQDDDKTSDSENDSRMLETTSNSTTTSNMSTRRYSSLEDASYGMHSDADPSEEQLLLLSWPTTRKKYTVQTHRAYKGQIIRPNPLFTDRCEKPDVVL